MSIRSGGVAKKTSWKLGYLPAAEKDADFLSDAQHDYLVAQFREMVEFEDPLTCPTVQVEKVDDYYALHDKGGILRKLNVRVYFTIESKHRIVVVLSTYKKEDEGMMPKWLKKKIEGRLKAVREELK